MTTPVDTFVRVAIEAGFGSWVVACRTGRGWSQVELAKRVGVNPKYLGRVERGQLVPSRPTLLAIAFVLTGEWSA